MEDRFDIVVLGAGPAGSAAAATAARSGLRCALVDRADFPRDKLCGGLFTGRSVRALGRIFDAKPEGALFLRSDKVRFSAAGRVLSEFSDGPPVYLTQRRALDAWLRTMALDQGAVPLTGHMQGLDEAAHTLTLRDGRELRYGVLIGADGVNSPTARALFGRAFDPDTIGFGLEMEVPHAALPPDTTVDVDFEAAAWGYGWRFPKPETSTVGVGGINVKNADMKARMAAYCAQLGVPEGAARVKGQFLPFGAFRKTPGRGAVMLSGDAAGLVDPITGEGIAIAMESGALAAQAALQAIAQEKPQTAFARYAPSIKPIHRSLAEARFWRRMIFSPSFHPAFLRTLAGSSLPPRFLRLLAGEIDYPDLRHDLARRFPGAVLKAMRTRFLMRR